MTVEERETSTEQSDAVRILLYAAAALVIVGIATALRVVSTFREQGIAWSISIDEMAVDATVGSGEASIDGIAQHVLVFADEVNPGTMTAIVASIALWAAAALLLIFGAAVIAGNFLRRRVFVRSNVAALSWMGWTLSVAPLTIVVLEVMARNGVMTAVGLEGAEPLHPLEFWSVTPLLLAGITVGLIARSFRRGVLLQRETEGLV